MIHRRSASPPVQNLLSGSRHSRGPEPHMPKGIPQSQGKSESSKRLRAYQRVRWLMYTPNSSHHRPGILGTCTSAASARLRVPRIPATNSQTKNSVDMYKRRFAAVTCPQNSGNKLPDQEFRGHVQAALRRGYVSPEFRQQTPRPGIPWTCTSGASPR